MEDTAEQTAIAASFLLGISYSNLKIIQNHLIMGETKEALSRINECLPFLTDKIEKHFYSKKEAVHGNTENATERQVTQ